MPPKKGKETHTHTLDQPPLLLGFVLRLWVLVSASCLFEAALAGEGSWRVLPYCCEVAVDVSCLFKVTLKPEVRGDTPYYCWVGWKSSLPS